MSIRRELFEGNDATIVQIVRLCPSFLTSLTRSATSGYFLHHQCRHCILPGVQPQTGYGSPNERLAPTGWEQTACSLPNFTGIYQTVERVGAKRSVAPNSPASLGVQGDKVTSLLQGRTPSHRGRRDEIVKRRGVRGMRFGLHSRRTFAAGKSRERAPQMWSALYFALVR